MRTATPRRPGLLLGAAALAPFRFGAARLYDKAGQVWLFTRQFKVPWASNASEQALKDPRRHRAVSGYWHTAVTLAGYCRIRCSLTSVRGHGQRAIGAVHAALLGRPWLPAPGTA